MEKLFLSEPSKKYEKSFKDYVENYKKINDEFYFSIYEKALENFDEYIKKLKDNSQGINVADGWVPYSTFWLIDKEEVVGVIRVRHKEIEYAGHIGCDISPLKRGSGYGTEALRMSLKKAKDLGIKEAIVTCDVENKASKAIIEKNGGKFIETIENKDENEVLYKYSISTERI